MEGQVEKKDRVVLKIIVLGCSNVGKSALIKRYTTGKFTENRVATIGSDFMTKVVDLMGIQVVLQIWDTAGQERFHQGTIGAPFYRGANGCLLVYDVTNEKSMEQLSQWRDELVNRIEVTTFFPIVVVGNKTDMRTELNTVDQTEVLKWCRDNEYGHVETSAKDDQGVQAAITAIAALGLDHRKEMLRSGAGERSKSVVRISDRYSKQSDGCCK
jgi:Ras-related protein Rab-7A